MAFQWCSLVPRSTAELPSGAFQLSVAVGSFSRNARRIAVVVRMVHRSRIIGLRPPQRSRSAARSIFYRTPGLHKHGRSTGVIVINSCRCPLAIGHASTSSHNPYNLVRIEPPVAIIEIHNDGAFPVGCARTKVHCELPVGRCGLSGRGFVSRNTSYITVRVRYVTVGVLFGCARTA